MRRQQAPGSEQDQKKMARVQMILFRFVPPSLPKRTFTVRARSNQPTEQTVFLLLVHPDNSDLIYFWKKQKIFSVKST